MQGEVNLVSVDNILDGRPSAVSVGHQVAISTSFAFGGLNCALIAKAGES